MIRVTLFGMIKTMFIFGIIALSLIALVSYLNGSDLKWLYCIVDGNGGNSVNLCENTISFLAPFVLLIPISLAYHFLQFKEMSMKKKTLCVSLIYPAFLALVLISDEFCRVSWCEVENNSPLGFLLVIFFPLLPAFLFSLITYKMREEVFLAWRHFSSWWIPLSIFLVLITPEGNSVIMSWGKEIPLLGMSAIYILVSTVIILRVWLKLRKEAVSGV